MCEDSIPLGCKLPMLIHRWCLVHGTENPLHSSLPFTQPLTSLIETVTMDVIIPVKTTLPQIKLKDAYRIPIFDVPDNHYSATVMISSLGSVFLYVCRWNQDINTHQVDLILRYRTPQTALSASGLSSNKPQFELLNPQSCIKVTYSLAAQLNSINITISCDLREQIAKIIHPFRVL